MSGTPGPSDGTGNWPHADVSNTYLIYIFHLKTMVDVEERVDRLKIEN